MTNGTRLFFAAPALIAALLVGWLILAERQILPAPQMLLQQARAFVCPTPGTNI